MDGIPRLIKRNPGDGKRKLECEDILNLYAFVDGRQVSLPTFVAAKLDRVPTVAPGDVDVYALAASVSAMSAQLESVLKRFDVAVSRSEIESLSKRVESIEMSTVNFPSLPTTAQPMVASASWPSATSVATDKPVSQRKPVVRVRGACSTTTVKAVPRVNTVAAFVGRLDIDTSEKDLVDLLEAADVRVAKCTKLKAKPGVTWNTAAFFVSCYDESKDVFYNEDIWPEGAELRDWYFK